jgi:hypothetical protein
MPDSERILAVLKDDLQRAAALHEQMKRNFRTVAGKPAANRAEERQREIEEASAVQSSARYAHVDAMIRFNAFLLYGAVPKHLRDSSALSGGAKRNRVTAR